MQREHSCGPSKGQPGRDARLRCGGLSYRFHSHNPQGGAVMSIFKSATSDRVPRARSLLHCDVFRQAGDGQQYWDGRSIS